MDNRTVRGYAIISKGDTPFMVNEEEFLIPSQSGNGKYKVMHKQEWTCECKDFQARHEACKHIHAVRFWLGIREKAKREGIFDLEKDVIDSENCPFCKSVNVVKNGSRRNGSNTKQRYLCRDCKKRFVKDPIKGFKGDGKIVTLALDLYFKGMSLRKIVDTLNQFYNIKLHHETVRRWIVRFTKIMNDYTSEIKVKSCGVITADETMVKVSGDKESRNWAYMWNCMDKDSRFLIASSFSRSREGVYAQAMLEEAKWRMEKQPRLLITDGYHGYQYAKRKVYGENPKVEHMHNIHFKNPKRNNNRMERLMGNVKERTKVMRGFDNVKTGGNMLNSWVMYYNFIRKHQALGMTPAEAIGVNLQLDGNKWLELLKIAENKGTTI